MSGGHVGDTRGSSIVSSAADVLWMSVVRGISGVCEMCMCLARGCVCGEGGGGVDERIGFWFGRVSVFGLWCGVSGEWVGGLDQGLEGCCGVMSVRVVSPDSLCTWQVQVAVYYAPSVQSCCTLLISASYSVFVYGRYRKSRLVCACDCRTWICLDITRFYEEQGQPSSGSEWPACPKTVNQVLIAGGGRFRHNLHSSL